MALSFALTAVATVLEGTDVDGSGIFFKVSVEILCKEAFCDSLVGSERIWNKDTLRKALTGKDRGIRAQTEPAFQRPPHTYKLGASLVGRGP